MSDVPHDGDCLVSCAGCGGALTRSEADELGMLIAANETFRRDLMDITVPRAAADPLHLAVTFHGLYECPRCGPYQRLRVMFLDAPPRCAA